MSARRLLIVAALLSLALPARALASASQPTLSYPTGHVLSMLAPADGTTAMSLTIQASHCPPACGPTIYDASSAQGWNDSTGGRCTQDGSNTGLYHCGADPPTLTLVSGSTKDDSIIANCAFLLSDYTAVLHATGGAGSDVIVGSCGDDDLDGGDGNDTLDGDRLGNDVLTGGAGNDTLRAGSPDGLNSGNSTLSGGDGRDVLTAQDGSDTLDGGGDGDRIEAGAGNDTIVGGGGSDYIIPGPGNDNVSGGTERDTVSYEDRDGSQGVTVNLDGNADSGVPGEADTLATDIENIVGSPGGDTINGTAAANSIDALEGNDTINPGNGSDQIDAGPGDDTINVRDGAPDTVDCGPGNDSVTVDELDTVSNCEQVNKPSPSNSFSAVASGKKLLVKVFAPGTVAVSDATVPLHASAAKKKRKLLVKPSSASGNPPTIAVRLRLSALARQRLKQTGTLKVKVRITFTPTGGSPNAQTKTIKLKK